MASITVDSAAFAQLLGDVGQAASKDSIVPMITGVLLHTATSDSGPVLAATATDRYCALHGHISVAGSLSSPVWLRNEQIAQVLTAVRPYTGRSRAGNSQIELSVEDGKVTIRQLALDGLADVSMSFPHDKNEAFPKVAELLTKSVALEASADPYDVDGKLLGKFARIAAGRGRHGSLRLRSTGSHKAVLAHFGTDLVGLLMPQRIGEQAGRPLDVVVYPVTVVDEEAAA